MALTGKQRHHLRALAHHLDPLVRLGKEGVSEGVLSALDIALEKHELVKVKLADTEDREEVGASLAKSSGAQVAQVIGRIVLVYRPRKKDPKIRLPR